MPRRRGRRGQGHPNPQVELIEVGLGGLRDLVVALAKRYPSSEAPLTQVVADALQNIGEGVRLLHEVRKGS